MNSNSLVKLAIAIFTLVLIVVVVFAAVKKNNSKKETKSNTNSKEVASVEVEDNTITQSPDNPSGEADIEEPKEQEEINTVTNWFANASICKPTMTENTISLEKADLSLLEDTSIADPWPMISLLPDAIPGTINYKEGVEDPLKSQQISSTFMVLVNIDTGEIVAERDCDRVIYPASMTKIMTVLTAMDYITEEDFTKTHVISQEIYNATYDNGLSACGFKAGDEVTVKDLLYGTIVCSGGDAAMALAEYCCGTQDAFVKKMNENVKLLGLSEDTHFTNPVGMYNDDLHTNMKDMAVILSVAVQNEVLLDVLSARTYETDTQYAVDSEGEYYSLQSNSTMNTDGYTIKGIPLSNWFLRRIEDKEVDGTVIAAKTGYVSQSGNCAASYYVANSGNRYVCVTGMSYSSWRTIYDHVGVYRSFAY